MKKYIPVFLTTMLIGGMTGASAYFQNPEIIFPEIAAIATGALLAPKFAWNTDKKRILFCISLCALLGIIIVRFVPLQVSLQMCLAFFIAQMIYLHSGTSFAPMISAIVLPVMLQTKSVVYVISAVILTSLILIFKMITEKANITEKINFSPSPLPEKADYLSALLKTAVISVWILLVMTIGIRFCTAPPLLVAFTEFCKSDSPAKTKKLPIFLLITVSGLTGVLFRYLLTGCFSLPLWIPAILTTLTIWLVMKKTTLFLPPASAIAILAFLIPENGLLWYPLQIAGGILGLLFLSDFCRKEISPVPRTEP